jgi:hypothetical protein
MSPATGTPLALRRPNTAGSVPSWAARPPAWDTSIIQEPREARQARRP